MSTLSRQFFARSRGRVTRFFHEEPERGSITLEQVIWYAAIGVVAVAVVAGIVAAINAFANQIPTG